MTGGTLNISEIVVFCCNILIIHAALLYFAWAWCLD